MRTKLFSLFLVLMASGEIMFAEIHSGTCGYNVQWTFDDEDGRLEISGTGAISNYSRDGSSRAPWSSYYIHSAIINDGVTGIGNWAFYNCQYMTSLTIGNSVERIGENAFTGCSRLNSVVIPNSVRDIKNWAFSECSKLTSISLGESVVSIENCCFEDCSSLTSVVIPNSVTTLGSSVFKNCIGLTSIMIPNSIVSMGGGVFSGCSSLISINLPDQITKIGDGTFEYCKNLSSIELPNGIDTIGSAAFSQCESLSSITIPNNITYIGHDAFSGCSSLTSVIIPNKVEGLENSTFAGCTNLTTVVLPESLTWIGNFTFADCGNLTSITIPDKVEVISYYAFENDSNLTSLTLGSGMKEIGGAFSGCYKLRDITCFASTPPILGTNSFQGQVYGVFDDIIYSDALLYIPKNSMEAYKTADQWKDFEHIYPIQYATEIESANVSATPTDNNSVILEWPEVSGADIYIVEIKQNEELVCTLSFDAQGKLVTLSHAVPSRNGDKRDMISATQTGKGWQYKLEGLAFNTQYSYTIIAKKIDTILFTQTINFSTTLSGVIEDIVDNSISSNYKVIHNGQLYILRDGKTYTVQGQEVK